MCPECRSLSTGSSGDNLKISVIKKRRRKPTINSSSTPTKRKSNRSTNSNTPTTPLTPPSASTLFNRLVVANLFNSPGTPLPNSSSSEHQWTNVMNSGDEVLPGSSTLNALIGAEAYSGYNSPSANNSTGEDEEPSTPTTRAKKRNAKQSNNNTPLTPTKKRRTDQDSASTRKKRKTAASSRSRSKNGQNSFEVSHIIDQDAAASDDPNNIKIMQMLLEHQAKVQNDSSSTRSTRRRTRQQHDERDYSDGIDEDADESANYDHMNDDEEDANQPPTKKRPLRRSAAQSRENMILDEYSGDEDHASDNEEIIMLEDKDFSYPKVKVTKLEAYNYIKKHAFGISKVPTLRPLNTLWAVCSLERKTLTPEQSSAEQVHGAK